jgi:hypothetical protein
MTVPCAVTTAEMREATRLNLNASLVWKLARGNTRLLIYIIVFTALVVVSLVDQHGIDWQKLALISGLLILLVALLLFSLNYTVAKAAKLLTKSGGTLTIDTQGVTAEAPNGTRTSIPWSAITRWREGVLVYTFGDAKTFRIVSKAALGEAQSGELRSLLLSQIREPVRS